MSASLKKMETRSAELRASMNDDMGDTKSGAARTPSPSPPKRGPSASGRSGSNLRVTRNGSGATVTPGGADMSQLALDHDEIRARYEDALKENESLRADAKRRLESYTRREKRYQEEAEELRAEISRIGKAKPQEEASLMGQLRTDHRQVMEGIETLQKKTSSVLQEQEKDLLRAFRARLYDVQIELEVERSKKDDGSIEWIERTRTLGKELDWSREEALRLDRVNRHLTKESARLKAQLKSQEDDRDFLVRQMLALKKENARLKPSADKAARERAVAGALEAIPQGRPATAGVAAGSSGLGGAARLGSAPAGGARRGASAAELVEGDEPGSLATQERLKELRDRAAENEARYREIVAKLKRLLEVERRNLRAVRAAHAQDLESRTELEALLRACVQDVKHEIGLQRQQSAGGKGSSSSFGASSASKHREVGLGDFGPQERERVMELLLSQERVVTLLYERTFPDRPHELLPAESAELREGEELGIDDPGL